MKAGVVNSRWELILPDHIAEWDAITGWEFPRFAAMEDRLRRGMTLFDIGAEHGWISAVYASFVGGENMVLVEPTPEFWRNIRLTWEHNGLPLPRLAVLGLCGATGRDPYAFRGGWPPCSAGTEAPAGGYRYLHEPHHLETTPVTTIDHLSTMAPPDAITIDVEGAELEVLLGARHTLAEHHPLVWVSIHPDLMERDYGAQPAHLLEYMGGFGYTASHLGTDHEEHWQFEP